MCRPLQEIAFDPPLGEDQAAVKDKQSINAIGIDGQKPSFP
jgi:hypothetical protein